MKEQNKIFIKSIKLNQDKIENKEIYPFNIEILKNFNEVKITSPVTFLIGENGTGKSTFIEALAISCGINPEGGTNNFIFSTKTLTLNYINT